MKRNALIRCAAWLLTLCAVMPMAVACGDDSGKNPGTTTAEKKETETIDENDPYADRLKVSDDLGEYDFKEYEYRIMSADGRGWHYFIEEDDSDVINTAIYQRNRAVEERFNCKIVLVGDPFYTESIHKINVDISTGDDVYDLVASHTVGLGGLVPSMLFTNWYDVPNVNFDKPWWSSSNEEVLTHYDVCYLAIGDLALSAMAYTYCMFYNKRLGADYDMPDVYEIVNNGEWTLDKITEMTKDIYTDLDMDGKSNTDNDMYGCLTDSGSGVSAYLWSFDNPIYKKGDDGGLECVYHTKKLSDIASKLVDFYTLYRGIRRCSFDATSSMIDAFIGGRALLVNGLFDHAISGGMRNMEDDYAILPYPKWDEAQENYYTMADGAHQSLAIPVTVRNMEAAGTITEALNAESYKILYPAYYDVALKVKGARDEESIKMLDMIKESCVFDFGFIYDGNKAYGGILFSQILRNNKHIESTWKRYERSATKWYDSILEAFENYEG